MCSIGRSIAPPGLPDPLNVGRRVDQIAAADPLRKELTRQTGIKGPATMPKQSSNPFEAAGQVLTSPPKPKTLLGL